MQRHRHEDGLPATFDTGEPNCYVFIDGKVAGEVTAARSTVTTRTASHLERRPKAGEWWPEYHQAITTESGPTLSAGTGSAEHGSRTTLPLDHPLSQRPGRIVGLLIEQLKCQARTWAHFQDMSHL